MTEAGPEPNIFFALSGTEFTPFGTSVPGVPLFYTMPSMALLETPTRWMFSLSLEAGRTVSPKTWKTYAEDLLDWLRT